MKSPVEFVKKNPGKTVLAVAIGAVVLVMMMRGSSPASSAASSGGYSAEQIAAGTAMAQMNAAQASQNSQIQGQLAALQIQSNTALQLADIERDARSEEMAVTYQLAQLQSAENMFAIEAQTELAQVQMSTQLEALNAQLNNQLANQSLFVQGQVDLAQISADVMNTSTLAQVDMAQIYANRDVQMAQIQSRTQRSSSRNSMWGAIAGAAIMMFCDVRIKNVAGCVDSEKCLDAIRKLPLDHWRYIPGTEPAERGDTRDHVGTYAQNFYKELGVKDYAARTVIDPVDIIGVMMGAIKELDKERTA
jgi:hypothetical protein